MQPLWPKCVRTWASLCSTCASLVGTDLPAPTESSEGAAASVPPDGSVGTSGGPGGRSPPAPDTARPSAGAGVRSAAPSAAASAFCPSAAGPGRKAGLPRRPPQQRSHRWLLLLPCGLSSCTPASILSLAAFQGCAFTGRGTCCRRVQGCQHMCRQQLVQPAGLLGLHIFVGQCTCPHRTRQPSIHPRTIKRAPTLGRAAAALKLP